MWKLRPLMTGLAVALLAGCWSDSSTPAKKPVVNTPAVAPPPLTQSPLRNTRPGVAYIGDTRCAACHREIAETYAAHPMGRSMRLAEDGLKQDLEAGQPATFEADGLTYSVSNDGGRMIHREQQFDAQGSLIFEKSDEVAYAVGAGSHGRSYLIRRDDSLWMSPITWYPQRGRWALSPSYEKENYHFTRPVLPDCVFCHANRAHDRPYTTNNYDRPYFSGLTIGCERCHGPGELHAARQSQGDAVADESDDTIVNPRRLDPVLRDGVCQQCHLAGALRIVRRGRGRYDYRPGLSLHEFMAVFVKKHEADKPAAVTSHEEQMRASRCHSASANKLACISCHNPHRKPEPQEKAAYFRERCLACHTDVSCREKSEARAATTPADNCLTCHMPAIPSEVQHAAMTDHRIPRHAGASSPASKERSGDGWPLAFFHREQVDAGGDEANRDLAVALTQFESEHPDLVGDRHLRAVVPILDAAIKRDPGDVDAIEALAHAQFGLNRTAQALATIEKGIQQAPNHEQLLAGAMLIAAGGREWEKASNYAARLIAINPHQVRYRQMAAQIALARHDPQSAVQACRAVVELNPADREARQMLAQLLQSQGQLREAQQQADILRRLPKP
ncbi:MAG: tetratricopeptide repeat protein [Planctomycetia bacterium]|nr:tetratricopeptide repeat protein [Planctomycetia bacterium]